MRNTIRTSFTTFHPFLFTLNLFICTQLILSAHSPIFISLIVKIPRNVLFIIYISSAWILWLLRPDSWSCLMMKLQTDITQRRNCSLNLLCFLSLEAKPGDNSLQLLSACDFSRVHTDSRLNTEDSKLHMCS